MKYAISSCLCGVNCKYNGKNNLNENLKKIYDEGNAILICPEVLGGLSTPRTPFEVLDDRAIDASGADITDAIFRGANIALDEMRKNGITKAILKSNSPSCGVGHIYDGTFTHTLIKGNGLAVRVFVENGIVCLSDVDFEGETNEKK